MSPFLAAILAVGLFAAPLAFFALARMEARARAASVSRGALLVDAGTPEEYAEPNLDGAINIPVR